MKYNIINYKCFCVQMGWLIMKKSIKIGIILIVLLATVFAVNVQASSLSWDSIKQSADAFEQAGNRNQLIKDDTIVKAVVPVGQMLTAIGVAVLFGSLLIIGIKYMMADAEKRGKLKQQLIGVVAAGIVIFGAYTIWNIAYNFFNDIF